MSSQSENSRGESSRKDIIGEREPSEMKGGKAKDKDGYIQLLKYGAIFTPISLVLFLFSIYVLVSKGPEKYGVDFAGGTELVIQFDKKVDAAEVRGVLSELGLGSAVVQGFRQSVAIAGDRSEFSIRMPLEENGRKAADVKSALKEKIDPKLTVQREDTVGPLIGKKITNDAITALIISLFGVLIYVSVRFEWRFALGAVTAVFHDVLITAGIFVLFGGQLSSVVVASLLTIIGYSINDTIVIYDRARENLATAYAGRWKFKGDTLYNVLDRSIYQTLSRTLLTAFTTFLVVSCLWLFGGDVLQEIALTFSVGIIIGCYSTIFIATPVALVLSGGGKHVVAK